MSWKSSVRESQLAKDVKQSKDGKSTNTGHHIKGGMQKVG